MVLLVRVLTRPCRIGAKELVFGIAYFNTKTENPEPKLTDFVWVGFGFGVSVTKVANPIQKTPAPVTKL